MILSFLSVTKLRSCLLCLMCLALGAACSEAEQTFPQVRVSTTLLEGVWLASPIVAVGEVSNIISYGHQTVDRLPPPTMPGVHDLYWCQGDFTTVAVLKGRRQGRHRKYLWASTIPGCKLVDNDPKLIYWRLKTKYWFLREEGQFLRPVFDYGTSRFEGVFPAWSEGPALPARMRMGALLLTPSANSDSLEDYARYLWSVGDIACELLGKLECTRRIRTLEGLGSPALRDSACGFLKGQLGASCEQD
jgi:hypothetical protein